MLGVFGILSWIYLIILSVTDIFELITTNDLKIAKSDVFNIFGDALLWGFYINVIMQLDKIH